MKQTRYLCIQGKYAPRFYLKNESAQNFRSLIESITLSNALVISSRYKSDLIYSAEEDLTNQLIKAWSAYKGLEFKDSFLDNFISASGDSDTLEYFFIKLAHVSMHRDWYIDFCQHFEEICEKEPGHALLKPIISCNNYLNETNNTNGGLPSIPVSSLKYSIQSFQKLAIKAQDRINKN